MHVSLLDSVGNSGRRSRRQGGISATRQIAVALIASIALVGFFAGVLVRHLETDYLDRTIREQSKRTVSAVSAAILDALIAEDRPILQTIVNEGIKSDPGIAQFEILNEDAAVLAAAGAALDPQAHLLKFREPIRFSGEIFGYISIAWNIAEREREIALHVRNVRAGLVAVLSILSLALYLFLDYLVLGPLRAVTARLRTEAGAVATPNLKSFTASELLELNALVTERFEMEEALRETRAHIDAAGEATLWVSEAGVVVYANTQAYRLFEQNRENVAPWLLRESIPTWRNERWVQLWREASSGEVLSVDMECITGSTRHFPASITMNMLSYAGYQVLCLFPRDTTVQRIAEEALRESKRIAEDASRTKSEFLATMSHEIRTPMNGVIGMTSVLIDTQLNAEQREFVEMVRSSAQSLLAIINDILDFSKIEAGKLSIEVVEISLDSVLRNALALTGPAARRKGIDFICRVDPRLPDAVIGDDVRIQQVLVNLVGNAVKFTERGEVELCLALLSQSEDSIVIEGFVRDTGIGIPLNKQQRIFDPFSQADGSTTRKYGGTGLGLGITAKLLGLMGGSIWVESEEGKGSRFGFRFSVQPSRAWKAPATDACATLRGQPAMLVGPQLTQRAVLTDYLEHLGMRVQEHEMLEGLMRTEREALRNARLVVVDNRSSTGDVFPVVQEILKNDVTRVSALMLLLDPETQLRDVGRCRELGIRMHLTKPFTRDPGRESGRCSAGATTAVPTAYSRGRR